MLHSRSLGLLQTSLSTWRERHLRITIDLDARCVAFIEHTSRKVIEGCWDQWTASLEQKGEMRRVAEQVGERWTVARGMGRWRERVTEVEVKGRKADVARDFFAERGAWNRWLCRVAERKRARWVEERVRRRKREVLLCEFADSEPRVSARLIPLLLVRSLAGKDEAGQGGPSCRSEFPRRRGLGACTILVTCAIMYADYPCPHHSASLPTPSANGLGASSTFGLASTTPRPCTRPTSFGELRIPSFRREASSSLLPVTSQLLFHEMDRPHRRRRGSLRSGR